MPHTSTKAAVNGKASGYAGGYPRVTDYIRALRANAGKDIKAFVPLKLDLDEVLEFDCSEESTVVDGAFSHWRFSCVRCQVFEVAEFCCQQLDER